MGDQNYQSSDTTVQQPGPAPSAPSSSLSSEQLLPLVYEELRQLARAQMGAERRDHTLQATALVHEAYVRLGNAPDVQWSSRAHFFNAAAEAMRRILIEHARARAGPRRGGLRNRVPLDVLDLASESNSEDILALEEALSRFIEIDPSAAAVVRLRLFAGLNIEETAATLEISERTVKREWAFARAWLFRELNP
jgi:RNA polymerase sigma factor (TIGR02999 family)